MYYVGHTRPCFFNLFKVAVNRNLRKGSKTPKRKLKMDSPTSAAAPSNVFVLSPTTYGRVCLCFIRAKVCQRLQLVCRKSFSVFLYSDIKQSCGLHLIYENVIFMCNLMTAPLRTK